MYEELVKIFEIVIRSLSKAWPFLLISIPFSVLIRVSGASTKINAGIGKQPILGILLATLFGAVSPLCSCTVIPVIYSLLLAGVPLGPVMAFWIASPSMDPEMFFLSVSTLGWNLAWWRLGATFVLSLSGGFLAHFLTTRKVFAQGILRDRPNLKMMRFGGFVKDVWNKIRTAQKKKESQCCQPVAQASCGCSGNTKVVPVIADSSTQFTVIKKASCCESAPQKKVESESSCCASTTPVKKPLVQRIIKESTESVLFVSQFLVIAYILEAIILLYVPSSIVENAVGGKGLFPIFAATFLGIPLYTTNMAALGILSGFLEKGMSHAAVLSFLIAGPTTTLPAMSAVFGITKPKIFALYLGIVFTGAILFGVLFLIFGGM